MPRIALLPGDGIGPEIGAAATRVLDALGDFEIGEHPIGGRLDRRARHRTHRRGARGLPVGRRGPALRRRRPQVGHDGPGQAAPGAGAARASQGPRAVRQPAAGAARARRCSTPARCGATGSRAPTCWSSASSPAASTSAIRAATATAPTTTAPTRSRRSSGSPGSAFEAAGERRGQGDLGRQGERAGDLAAVARDRHEARARVRGRRARPPAGRQRRHAAGLAAGRVRRDRHREPVRRHPQRRGRDAHRLARDAALGEPGRGRPRAVRAGARLGARHRRAPARPTRSRPCSRWR